MSEMIPGASGLQIECGLFLWFARDVEKLLKVIDSICVDYGELVLIHGEIHHWRTMELDRNGDWEGMMKMDVVGESHHVVDDL
jgi:hypothetical protein